MNKYREVSSLLFNSMPQTQLNANDLFDNVFVPCVEKTMQDFDIES